MNSRDDETFLPKAQIRGRFKDSDRGTRRKHTQEREETKQKGGRRKSGKKRKKGGGRKGGQ